MVKYEVCPKCGKKGLHEVHGDPIGLAMIGLGWGDKKCRYCGYVDYYEERLLEREYEEFEKKYHRIKRCYKCDIRELGFCKRCRACGTQATFYNPHCFACRDCKSSEVKLRSKRFDRSRTKVGSYDQWLAKKWNEKHGKGKVTK